MLPSISLYCSEFIGEDFSLTMGEFFGAAVFILTLVLGCVLLSPPGATTVEPYPFLRDAGSYSFVLVFMTVCPPAVLKGPCYV